MFKVVITNEGHDSKFVDIENEQGKSMSIALDGKLREDGFIEILIPDEFTVDLRNPKNYANNQQGGNHYGGYENDKWDAVALAYVLDLDHVEYSVLKYLMRHRDKDGAKDLRKLIHFAAMILQHEYGVITTFSFKSINKNKTEDDNEEQLLKESQQTYESTNSKPSIETGNITNIDYDEIAKVYTDLETGEIDAHSMDEHVNELRELAEKSPAPELITNEQLMREHENLKFETVDSVSSESIGATIDRIGDQAMEKMVTADIEKPMNLDKIRNFYFSDNYLQMLENSKYQLEEYVADKTFIIFVDSYDVHGQKTSKDIEWSIRWSDVDPNMTEAITRVDANKKLNTLRKQEVLNRLKLAKQLKFPIKPSMLSDRPDKTLLPTEFEIRLSHITASKTTG